MMDGRDEVNTVINRMIAAMNRHDLEACLACYSADAEMQDPRFPEPTHDITYVREGFSYWFNAFPDVQVEVVNRIIDGPQIALEWTFEATHRGEYLGVPGSGRRFKVLTAAHFAVRDGKVVRDYSMFDASSLRLLEELAAPPDGDR